MAGTEVKDGGRSGVRPVFFWTLRTLVKALPVQSHVNKLLHPRVIKDILLRGLRLEHHIIPKLLGLVKILNLQRNKYGYYISVNHRIL